MMNHTAGLSATDVRRVFAVIVGPYHRPYHQHRRTGRAHDAGQQRADGKNAGIERRRAMQVAAHANAPGDHEQRRDQDNERNELGQESMRSPGYSGPLAVAFSIGNDNSNQTFSGVIQTGEYAR